MDVVDMHAGLAKERGNFQERATIPLLRRRVHDDAAGAVVELDAEIAAKADIGRGRYQGELMVRKVAGQEGGNPIDTAGGYPACRFSLSYGVRMQQFTIGHANHRANGMQ